MPPSMPVPTPPPTPPSPAPGPGARPAPGAAPPPGTVEFSLLRVSEYAAEAARDEALLSEAERSRAAAFVREADRDRYRVAHVALRRELAARLGGDPAALELTRADCPVCGGPHGRPSVPGDPLHFSLSHAGDVVLLGFAATPVGVDVEEHPRAVAVAELIPTLHPRERDECLALPEARRPEAFARCWTRKEAYLKGTGTGLAEAPSVSYVGTGEDPGVLPGWRLDDIDAPPGYAAASALALREGNGPDGTGCTDGTGA
ncbi:4'-phosphopantetheinyl transferase family protein [Streptomyces daliensis]